MGEDSNKHVAIQDREFRFNFRCMGSNLTEFRDMYNERFDERKTAVEDALVGMNAKTTGNKRTMIRGIYSIDDNGADDFFNGYTAALHEAFSELVVENGELIQILTELFDDSVEQYR